MRSLYTKFQLFSYKSEGGVGRDSQTFFWKSDETGVNTIEKRVDVSVNRGCNMKMV